jgi:hypothetical protein
MFVILVVELINVIGSAMGVVPYELFWFKELTGFEYGFRFIHLDFVWQQRVKFMAA